MIRRTKRIKGGDVFEGSEGCVFVPELVSNELLLKKYPKRSGKFITKVYRRQEDLITELKGIALMKQIDPTGQYTKTFVDNTTRPDLTSISPNEDCTKPIKNDSPALYMYYGGVSISSLKKTGKLNEVLRPVILGLARLGDLFVNMDKFHIYHSDVQPGNLLYNMQDRNVYLIDFTGVQQLPKISDRSIDIKSLASVIFTLISEYQEKIMSDTNCYKTLAFLLDKNKELIDRTTDVAVIDTILKSTVDSFVKTCFSGGKKRKQRNRKTLRRRTN